MYNRAVAGSWTRCCEEYDQEESLGEFTRCCARSVAGFAAFLGEMLWFKQVLMQGNYCLRVAEGQAGRAPVPSDVRTDVTSGLLSGVLPHVY